MRAWGLVHSSFVIAPVSVIGLSRSYSAAKAWCAYSGTDAMSAATPRAPAVINLDLIVNLLVEHNTADHEEDAHHPDSYRRARCRAVADAAGAMAESPRPDRAARRERRGQSQRAGAAHRRRQTRPLWSLAGRQRRSRPRNTTASRSRRAPGRRVPRHRAEHQGRSTL